MDYTAKITTFLQNLPAEKQGAAGVYLIAIQKANNDARRELIWLQLQKEYESA